MDYNVKVKKASIRLREMDLFKRLVQESDQLPDVDSFRTIDRLIQTLEEVRGLKVAIICLVSEIDNHGDHYLGHLDLRQVLASRGSGGGAAAAAAAGPPHAPPPIPPKPSVLRSAPSQAPKPNFCILEMRVPTSVSCTGGRDGANAGPRRTSSCSSNSSTSTTLTPFVGAQAAGGGLDASPAFLRSTSQCYASLQHSPRLDGQSPTMML